MFVLEICPWWYCSIIFAESIQESTKIENFSESVEVTTCSSSPISMSISDLINSSFYVYHKSDKRIECYDINGDLVDGKCLENISEETAQNFSFGYFNNRFIIGTEQTKKIIRI